MLRQRGSEELKKDGERERERKPAWVGMVMAEFEGDELKREDGWRCECR